MQADIKKALALDARSRERRRPGQRDRDRRRRPEPILAVRVLPRRAQRQGRHHGDVQERHINEPHNIGIGEVNYQFGLLGQIDLFPNGPSDPNQVNPMLFYGSDPPAAGQRRVHVHRDANHGNGFLATNVVWKGAAIPGIAKATKITFTAPGTFTYMCQIHPIMVGTVNVHP